jgi:pyruvate/2-oxoglutarate dehydrogenase complex dihydrolipoamide dehydrogenase (E3) component
MDRDYDLIVIGGGAAGLAAARAGAAARARTLLVAEGQIGGECTFTGCVPSKTLIEAAARGASFTEAAASVREAVAAIAATETAEVLVRRGIEVVRGHAAFTSPREVAVAGRVLRARGFVVATGSRAALPPVPGLAGVPYLTNEDVFDLTELPASLAILGGGAVGCELAQAFARLGSQVTLVEAAPRLLPAADPAAAAVIGEVFTAEGITVRAGSPVKTVTSIPNGSGCLLQLHDSTEVAADKLLVAAGHAPATAGLGLDAAGIRLNDRGAIAVNGALATAASGVYAAGDVTGLMPFTHAAYAMGRIAARNALRKHRPAERFSTAGIPWAVFTDPEVAQAGLTEQQAAASVPGARVACLPMSEVDRAVTAGRTEGFIKIIAGPRRLTRSLGGGRILGATIVAPRAGDMIGEIALAMRAGLFTGRLAQATRAYPTWSLAVQQAAAQFFGGYGDRAARPARTLTSSTSQQRHAPSAGQAGHHAA